MTASAPLFLGLDCSTQGLKATVLSPTLKTVANAAINYQGEFGAAYKTHDAVHRKSGHVVTQPSAMVR
jgi:sugar (pentulose or hexulose) kinase